MTPDLALALLAGGVWGLVGIGCVRLLFACVRVRPAVREWTLRIALLLPILVAGRAYVNAPSTADRLAELRPELNAWMQAPKAEGQLVLVSSPPGTMERIKRTVRVQVGWPPPLGILLTALGLLWGGGVVYLWSRTGRDLFALRRWARDTADPPPALQRIASEEGRAAGVSSVRLRVSTQAGSPFAAPGGLLVVPDWLEELPELELRAVIAHEVAHLRRRDPARQVGTRLLNGLTWPLPCASWMRDQLRAAVEHRCDDWAIHRVGDGRVLARALAEVAERMRGSPQGGPAEALLSGAPLGERVERALGDRRAAAVWPGVALSGLLVLAALIGPALRPPGDVRVHVQETRQQEARLGASQPAPATDLPGHR